jgi:hypothetical protein
MWSHTVFPGRFTGFWVCLMAHFTKNGFCLQKRNSSFIKITHLEAAHVLKMILQYQLTFEDHKKIAILLLQCVTAYFFFFVSVIFRWLVFVIFSLDGHNPEFLLWELHIFMWFLTNFSPGFYENSVLFLTSLLHILFLSVIIHDDNEVTDMVHVSEAMVHGRSLDSIPSTYTNGSSSPGPTST